MTLEDGRSATESAASEQPHGRSIGPRPKEPERLWQHVAIAGKRLRFKDVRRAEEPLGRSPVTLPGDDADEQSRAEAQLRLSASAFEHCREAIVMFDCDGTLLAINPAFTRMTGYSAADAVGRAVPIPIFGGDDAAFRQSLWEALHRNGHWEGDFSGRRKDGTQFPAWGSINAVRDADQAITHYVGVALDISDRKAAEERVRQLAYFDALTDLANRRLLEDRVQRMVAQHRRKSAEFSVLFVDLDRFKRVNDSYGYPAGDEVLKHVAECLRGTVRDADTLARWGGDEFVVALAETGAEGAARVAERIFRALGEPFMLKELQITLGACIGISVFPHDGTDVESLLRHAGIAAQKAKARGRRTVHFFKAARNVEARERLALEQALRTALERDELVLSYRPQVKLADGKPIGIAAVVDWHHPELGTIPASTFVPIAESIGAIDAIGEWALREACRQNRSWQRAGVPPLRIAVGLALTQLRNRDFVQQVVAIAHDAGLAPEWLEFEVTESALVQRARWTLEPLRALHALGIGLVLDNFGTGCSSLAYLKQFPVTKIKLDRSFVRDPALDTAAGTALVRMIIAAGQNLHLDVVADDVQTQDEAATLAHLGCTAAQGSWFAAPMPGAAVPAWLASQQAGSRGPRAPIAIAQDRPIPI